MKPRSIFAFSRAIAITLALAIVSGCNLTSQEEPEGSQQGSQYGSQAQAEKLGHPAGPLEGQLRLEYNHDFSFKFSGGTLSTDYDVTVKGEIPLAETHGAFCPMVCKDDRGGMVNQMGYCRQVTGSGKVNFEGTLHFTAGSKTCDCTLPETIDVSIEGRSFHEWVTPGDYCQLESLALKVKETWGSERSWSCVCNTPEEVEQMHLEENMAMFPSIENPDLDKVTMIFPVGCPADSELKEDLLMAIIGQGTYRWILHTGGGEGPNRMDWGPQYLEYGTVTPKPMQCRDGHWGPPLEDIEEPLQWEPIQ